MWRSDPELGDDELSNHVRPNFTNSVEMQEEDEEMQEQDEDARTEFTKKDEETTR